jgi:ribose transport system ATP-binding protein
VIDGIADDAASTAQVVGAAMMNTEPAHGEGAAPTVEAVGISRSFGGVHALVEASFQANRGEVHALVGENGAGKTTMIRILSGMIRPDTGTVCYDGVEVKLTSPHDAQERGVGTVSQELTLFPWLSVAENLLLRDPPTGLGRLVRRRALVPGAEEILAAYGLESVDPGALAGNLPLEQRQLVEIVRTVRRDPRILFLDEPSAALSATAAAWLYRLIRRLRDEGRCVVFTSHRWREVEDLADRITVFRNGRHVTTRAHLDEATAVRLMTGRTIDRVYPKLPPSDAAAAPLFEVRDLSGPALRGVSLTLRPGEIVGVGGIAGQGQRELFRTLFGADRAAGGQLLVDGRPVRIRRPWDAISNGIGIALVPEDRKSEGLLLPMTVRDNLTLAILGRVSRFGVLSGNAERQAVERMVRRLAIRTDRANTSEVGTLSGGNQQKVLLGRWLLTQARVLLLYDVARGVDVGTKHELYRLITELAAEGKAVLLYSSETEEVANLSHRVVVMRAGRVVAELPGPVTDPEAIVAASLAASDQDTGEHTTDGTPESPGAAAGTGTGTADVAGSTDTPTDLESAAAATVDPAALAGGRAWRRVRAPALRIGRVPVPLWRQQSAQQAPLLLALTMLTGTLALYAALYRGRQGIFPSTFDWTNLIDHSLPLVLAAVGQGIVVLIRGLDLSVGGMVDLTNGLAATRLEGAGPAAMVGWSAAILLVGAIGGLVNGFLVAWARLQPILVTLATLAIYQGLALWVLPTPGGQVPSGFTAVLTNPNQPTGLVWVGVVYGLWFVFRRSRFGVGVFALGNDPEAARANGLPVARHVVLAYVTSGVCAAAAGLFLAATTTSGDATSGNVFILTSIAAVVLGGISFNGGRGSLAGAIAGAFTLTLIVNVLFFAGIDPLYQSFYQGMFLIAAVLVGTAAGRLARRRQT